MVRIRDDSFGGRIWHIPEAHDHAPIPDAPYPEFVTKLLRRRGVETAAAARTFLFDDDQSAPPAGELPGVAGALDRLERAIDAGEAVVVYGDFDVDGVTATAILVEAIRAAGGRASAYIPDRFEEGYGLNLAALAALRRERGAALVITADCGITSHREVAAARDLGMDVVIVDHHSAPPTPPDACAIVNPKLPGSDFTLRDLSAGGVAAQIAPALLARRGLTADPRRWLDLAALSTVADVVPLIGENRWIVREGLRALEASPRPGIRALLAIAGLGGRTLDADAIGFQLAPRLNAAGRLAHATLALELLTTGDPERAAALAQEIDTLNVERRRLTLDAMERVRATGFDPGAPLTFAGATGLSAGIVGIIAGRLAEEGYRPAVVYEEGPEESRASCRSIPEFDIAAALRTCDDLFLRYGGHAMAAGFTARTADLPEIRARLTAVAAQQLASVRLQARLDIDAQVALANVRGPQIAWLERLAPFGAGNPAPLFLSPGVAIHDLRRVGADASHLRLTLRDGEALWPGIGFGLGAAPFAPGDRVDVVWTIKRNGRDDALELDVRDLAPARA